MHTVDMHTVLITGGAGGIGRAMARRFIADGHTVVACGRSEQRLAAAVAEVPGLRTIACDITVPDDVAILAGRLAADFPALDTVINNAALNHPVDIHEATAPARIEAEVRTNILGTVNVTTALLPLLEKQERAWLGIVTSGIAYAPAPDVPGYSLTKAALHSLARSLRHTLRTTPVRVVEIVPPAVDTDMIAALECKKMAPDDVAARVARGLWSGRREIRMGQTHLSYRLNRLSPALAERLIRGSFD